MSKHHESENHNALCDSGLGFVVVGHNAQVERPGNPVRSDA